MQFSTQSGSTTLRIENIKVIASKTTPVIKTKVKNFLATIIILFGDLLVVFFSMYVAYLTRLHILPRIHTVFKNSISFANILDLWWVPFLCILVIAYDGLYYKRLPYWLEVKSIIKAVVWSIGLAVAYLFLSKTASSTSRTLLSLTFIYMIFLLPFSRLIIKKLLVSLELWQKYILIIGSGKKVNLIYRGFQRENTMGFRVIGLLADSSSDESTNVNHNLPILGKISDIEEIMNKTEVRDILIATSGIDNKSIVDITNRLQRMSAKVMLAPDLFGIPLSGIEVEYLFDEKAIILAMRNNLASVWNRSMKRIFDILLSILILIPALPIMAMIGLLIKIDSKGPVIFGHSRIGQNGQSFKCLKFRTMVQNSQEVLEKLLQSDPKIREEWEREFKLKNDPRITRVGKFLRKTSLDELPQLFNVLLGQMSLVGPRPIITDEIQKYGEYFKDFSMVTPGITGLWQVSGRNDIDYEERVQLDVWYVRNWSLWLDVVLLFRTVGVVLGRKGAY